MKKFMEVVAKEIDKKFKGDKLAEEIEDGELVAAESEDEETEDKKKLDVSKILDMKTGGNEREVTEYIQEEKEDDDKKDGCCDSYVPGAPELRLNNKQNPEVTDFEMGDIVTVKMLVTGLDYNVNEEDGVKCRVELNLVPKK